MQQQASAEAGGHQPDVLLVELSVVLVANGMEPSMINPDFLRHNGIVDRDLPITGQPISTPAFSQVSFEGGVTVTAEPSRFLFAQRGVPLTEDSCTTPEIARRFLDKIPYPPYSAIGINPTGVRPSNGDPVDDVADVLIDGGRWMRFNGVLPVIGLKALYDCEDRRINLTVDNARGQNSDGSKPSGLIFYVNIHRDIVEIGQQERVERIRSILSGWKDDISDLKLLVEKFDSNGGES